MKAAQLLLLLIAFIAASHLRREAILMKHRGVHTQQNEEQAIAENVNWLKDNPSATYSGGTSLKMARQKMSFNYDKKRQ